MEFLNNPDDNLLIKSINSLDNGLWNLKKELTRRFPDAAPTAQDIQQVLSNVLDTARGKVYGIQDSLLFNAMGYPMMVALTEGAIGTKLLMQVIEDRKQITRRGFLKKVGTGFKTAAAVWLSMPLIESLLFLGFGVQGDFVHPNLRKLIEKTHPETWFFILTLRNVVLAQKEQWLMEQMGDKPHHIATIIGAAHTGLEDQIRKSPEERLKFLQAVKPLLEHMFVPESVYKMVQFEFNEKRLHWRPTKIFEIPELKELVKPQTYSTEIAQKNHICIDQPKMAVEGEETLLDRAELKEFQEHDSIGGAQLQIDGIPGEESSWDPGTVHFEVKKFRNRKEMVGVINMVTGWDSKDYEWSDEYEAYVLSIDLKRNLDMAPWHIKPVIHASSIEDVSEAENKPRSRDNVIVEQIRFYVNEKNAAEIKKRGCTVLIHERRRIDDSPVERFTRRILTLYPSK